jgi:uncharacterized protein
VLDFLTALGLVFAIEGLLFAAFPGAMRRAMAAVAVSPDNFLRMSGLASALVGVAIVFLVRLLFS